MKKNAVSASRIMGRLFLSLALPVSLCSCGAGTAPEDRTLHSIQELPWIEARLGTHPLRLMVARTESEKRKGLMFRRELGESEGMLFVYEVPELMTFWMKNTILPLDLIFFSPRLEVTELIPGMKPGLGIPDAKLPGYASRGEAQYALELKSGTIERWGIAEGDRLIVSLPRQ